jgi:Flp pilus assembly protein CpaB
MKPRTLLLLVVAIGCGLVAAFMVNQISGRQQTTDTEMVFTAVKDIPMGTPLTDESMKTMVKLTPMPKGVIPLDAIREQDASGVPGIQRIANKVVGRSVSANSPITIKDISTSTESLVKELDPGYRAITVRATLENAHHGFVLPGSRVDVICTTTPLNDPRLTVSRIFLQNVKVLACNTLTSQPEQGSTVGNPVTVTLAVKPDEAERMYWVTSKSIVGILLRKPGDENKIETKGVSSPYENDEGPEGPKTGQTVQVPTAIKNFDPGETITQDQLKMVPFQKGQLPEDVVISMDELKDKMVHRFVSRGSFITRVQLTPLGVEVTKVDPGKHTMRILQGPRPAEVIEFPIAPREPVPPGTPSPTPGAGRPAPGTPSEAK